MKKGPIKKLPKEKKKKLPVVLCWLTEVQKPDEKKQPILWTERPTDAVTGAGSLWPSVLTLHVLDTHGSASATS